MKASLRSPITRKRADQGKFAPTDITHIKKVISLLEKKISHLAQQNLVNQQLLPNTIAAKNQLQQKLKSIQLGQSNLSESDFSEIYPYVREFVER